MVIVVAFVGHISKSKNNKKEEKIEKNKRSPKVEDDTYHLSSGHRKKKKKMKGKERSRLNLFVDWSLDLQC